MSKVKVKFAPLCLIPCKPMGCSLSDSFVHGIPQARLLEWAAILFPGDLPDPGVEPGYPALQADSLTTESPCREVLKKSKEKHDLFNRKKKYMSVCKKQTCIEINFPLEQNQI